MLSLSVAVSRNITGMTPKQATGIIPSATRDCSTYQFRYSALSELEFHNKINFGPGYRIYFGKDGNRLIILLCGGNKKTQKKDIEKAKQYWQDYKDRKKQEV